MNITSLLDKNTFSYSYTQKSNIIYQNKKNCCFISSFYIQIKNIWNDFISFDKLIEILYPNTNNLFTDFVNDFPIKWNILKNFMIKLDCKWLDRLDKIIFGFFIPLTKQDQCVLLTYIDINKINPNEIKFNNYTSLEKSFTDEIPSDKISINIMQLYNHFEPIEIIQYVGKLDNIEFVDNKHFLN